MSSLKIIVNVFYKPSNFLVNLLSSDDGRLYYPINGGCSLKSHAQEYPWLHYDDVGDNMSQHNHALNEMTSIYWFWKNYPWKECFTHVGFNHYRRFFRPKDFADYSQYDLVVAKPYLFKSTIGQQYAFVHNLHDLNIMLCILDKFSIYANEFRSYLDTKTFYAPCNMFIMKTSLFDKYCTFMFPILMQLVNNIDLQKYNKFQHRAIAFLSERLTSWWVSKQMMSFKVKQVPIEFKP